jgi:hypothetical protein
MCIIFIYIYIRIYIYIVCVLLFLHSAADEADFVLLYIHITITYIQKLTYTILRLFTH